MEEIIAKDNINEVAAKYIEDIAEKCKRIKPLLVIHCITYNHEPYLRDALEGFVMQQTNFPFVAVVHDDASTDKTADVLREYAEKYPDIILPIFEKENQYSKRLRIVSKTMWVADAATGAKYVAMCEGDDYWTDPHKLQKQVDFLESHPDYSGIYTRVRQYENSTRTFLSDWGGKNETFEELLNANSIPTVTMVFRLENMNGYDKFIQGHNKTWLMGDYPLWLYLSINGKIKFLQGEPTAVYRILQKSASHNPSKSKKLQFEISVCSIKLWFAEKMGYNKKNPKLFKIWNLILLEKEMRLALVNKDDSNYKISLSKLKKEVKCLGKDSPKRYKLISIFPKLGLFLFREKE